MTQIDYVSELELKLQAEDISQISGYVFKTHVTSDGIQKRANTTVHDFCNEQAEIVGRTSQEYAKRLIQFMDAPKEQIYDM